MQLTKQKRKKFATFACHQNEAISAFLLFETKKEKKTPGTRPNQKQIFHCFNVNHLLMLEYL